MADGVLTNLTNPVTTATITVLTGVFVIVMSQIFLKFFLEPIQKQYEQIGKITDSLVYYQELWQPNSDKDLYKTEIYDNLGNRIPDKEIEQGKKLFRRQSSELLAITNVIKWYRLFSFLRMVRKKVDIENASLCLNNLSRGIGTYHNRVNYEEGKQLMESLGIKSFYDEAKFRRLLQSVVDRVNLDDKISKWDDTDFAAGIFEKPLEENYNQDDKISEWPEWGTAIAAGIDEKTLEENYNQRDIVSFTLKGEKFQIEDIFPQRFSDKEKNWFKLLEKIFIVKRLNRDELDQILKLESKIGPIFSENLEELRLPIPIALLDDNDDIEDIDDIHFYIEMKPHPSPNMIVMIVKAIIKIMGYKDEDLTIETVTIYRYHD